MLLGAVSAASTESLAAHQRLHRLLDPAVWLYSRELLHNAALHHLLLDTVRRDAHGYHHHYYVWRRNDDSNDDSGADNNLPGPDGAAVSKLADL